ncbi:hypothetical protein Ancab_028752 [Ancistrocladus abbreviatus]
MDHETAFSLTLSLFCSLSSSAYKNSPLKQGGTKSSKGYHLLLQAQQKAEMLMSISEAFDPAGAESEDAVRFLKSLQELRQLRSQIHYAADYCEMAFFKAKDKKEVMDNTKEYICRAVVTVVDHVGTVSANINSRLKNSDKVAETELRINCLKQKLLSCEYYNHNHGLTRIHWKMDFPRCYPRYISLSISDRSVGGFRESHHSTVESSVSKEEVKNNNEEEVPLFMHTSTHKVSLIKIPTPQENEGKATTVTSLASVLPVQEGLSIPTRARSSLFHFQVNVNPQKQGRRMFHWKLMLGAKLRSLVQQKSKESSKLFRNLA